MNPIRTKADFIALPTQSITLECPPKVFSTGSVGYGFNGKVNVTLPDGRVITCQASCNVIVPGSKALPDPDGLGDAAAERKAAREAQAPRAPKRSALDVLAGS